MGISYKNSDGTWSTLDVPISVKGGTAGSGTTIITLKNFTKSTVTEEELTAVKNLMQQIEATGKIPNDYVLFLKNKYGNTFYAVSKLYTNVSNGYTRITFYADFVPSDSYQIAYQYVFHADTLELDNIYEQTSTVDAGDDWMYATSVYDSGLYQAKELYIRYYESGTAYRTFSHVVFYDDILGNNTHTNFPYVTVDAIDNDVRCWFYDGSAISHSNSYGGYIEYIAYKV